LHHQLGAQRELSGTADFFAEQHPLTARLRPSLTKRIVRRAPPQCGTCNSGDEMSCSNETKGLLSGHTAAAFAGAG
jgi:hypothetical protein